MTSGANLAAGDLTVLTNTAGDIVSGEFRHEGQEDVGDVRTRRVLSLVQGSRVSEIGAASNPSGWAGVLKIKALAGATLGHILLYSNP